MDYSLLLAVHNIDQAVRYKVSLRSCFYFVSLTTKYVFSS